jgi:hypothetical protein
MVKNAVLRKELVLTRPGSMLFFQDELNIKRKI